MRKEIIKRIRNNMIRDIWEQEKAEWEMKDIAYLFGVSLPQVYRIIKGRQKETGKTKK